MRNPDNLIVYVKAHELAVSIQLVSGRINRRDFAALIRQLRAASASVPANIREGCGHSSRREFVRFLQMAAASASEVEQHLRFARDTRALDADVVDDLLPATRKCERCSPR